MGLFTQNSLDRQNPSFEFETREGNFIDLVFLFYKKITTAWSMIECFWWSYEKRLLNWVPLFDKNIPNCRIGFSTCSKLLDHLIFFTYWKVVGIAGYNRPISCFHFHASYYTCSSKKSLRQPLWLSILLRSTCENFLKYQALVVQLNVQTDSKKVQT